MSAIFERQNDATALTYLKASKYCSKQKQIISYYIIIVSLLVTLASIALRIAARYTTLPEVYSQAVVLISGLVLISNIFCSFLEYEYNVMSVNFLERYDIYVFGLPANQALLRVIPEQKIIYYARKFNRKKVKNLRNFYFKTKEEAEQKNISFLNIKKNFEHSHRLLLHVYGVFVFLWVGYAVIIFLIAIFLSARDTFIDTLINIFVPALSTISLIATSWRRYNEQSRRLSNAVKVSSDLALSAAQKDSTVSLQSQHILRGLQDVRFNLRNNDFTVPVFMSKMFEKRLKKEEELMHNDGFIDGLALSKAANDGKYATTKTIKKQPAKEAEQSMASEVAAVKKTKDQPKQAEKEPPKEQIKPAVREANRGQASEPTKPAMKEATKETAKPAAKEATKEPTKPIVKEAVKEPMKPAAKTQASEPTKPAAKVSGGGKATTSKREATGASEEGLEKATRAGTRKSTASTGSRTVKSDKAEASIAPSTKADKTGTSTNVATKADKTATGIGAATKADKTGTNTSAAIKAEKAGTNSTAARARKGQAKTEETK